MSVSSLSRFAGFAAVVILGSTCAIAEPPVPEQGNLAGLELIAALADDIETTGSLPEHGRPTRFMPGPTRAGTADMTTFNRAVAAYRAGRLADADRLAADIDDPMARITLEWVAIRTSRAGLGFNRLNAFISANPGFPMVQWVRRRAEDALFNERRDTATVEAFFRGYQPEMATGKLALALAHRARGNASAADALVRSAWDENGVPRGVEAFIFKTFPGVIDRARIVERAHAQIFDEEIADGLRLAAMAGADHLALARALAAGVGESKAMKVLDAVPPALRQHPSFAYARAQLLRRNGRGAEAAQVMLAAPRDSTSIIDGDAWWTARRLLARRLLDDGEPQLAYRIASQHAAKSSAQLIEAEFHAGWIALRFLKDAASADRHFARAAMQAETPISVARTAYWRGRAAEDMRGDHALHYERAARFPITYYGQLAKAKLGRSALPLRVAQANATDRALFERLAGARAIRTLLDAGHRDLAQPLITDMAQGLPRAGLLDALGDMIAEERDAKLLLGVGKTAVQRGFSLDHHAYPTFGIPRFEPVDGSAEKAMVYAIARQESAFDAKAVSHANARGLMQMLPSTAARTARRFGLPFNPALLTSDPAANARLGAAHLGELMAEYGGSYVLTFAAYNAGDGRVREWINAYGDPRQPGTDVVDWVERIPFSETRNYVQRVMENLQVYRARLSGNRAALLIESDLRRGRP